MTEKINAIKAKLLKEIPGRTIQYLNTSALHKFRIEGEGPTHWLYISEELVDDSQSEILINLIHIYHIIENLKNSNESKWLFLESNGIREVDEDFSK